MASSPEPKLLSFPEARSLVEDYASKLSPTEPEMLSLLEGLGLVLAEDLLADRDFPPFPRSTRDGFAVRAADVELSAGAAALRWRDQGRRVAGAEWHRSRPPARQSKS